MKLLIVCFFLVGSVLATNKLRPNNDLNANLNDYVDAALPGIIEFLVENGFDPMDLPDVLAEFSAKPIIITYHGKLELTNGILMNIRSLHRSGDVLLRYHNKELQVIGNFGINDIDFDYNYLAKIMNIGPSGGVKGSLSSANIHFEISIDFETLSLSLNKFAIDQVGSIRVRFTGNVLVDWLTNVLVRVVTAIFKDTLIGFVENKIKEVIEDFLNNINNNVGLAKVLLHTKSLGIANINHIPIDKYVKKPAFRPPMLYLDMTNLRYN